MQPTRIQPERSKTTEGAEHKRPGHADWLAGLFVDVPIVGCYESLGSSTDYQVSGRANADRVTGEASNNGVNAHPWWPTSSKEQNAQMSKADLFGFFPVTETSTQHAGFVACELAEEFSNAASSYGDGVKTITVSLMLTDPRTLGRKHKDTTPEYISGLRRVEAHGITMDIEDALTFSLRPAFDAVLGAVDRAAVASAIASAMLDIHSQLSGMSIPDFDMQRFLSDVESFFAGAAHSDGVD